MGPSAIRIAILIVELTVFFIVTAFTTHFFSYAGALQYSRDDAPPPQFPVIAYDGDPRHPEAKNYLVVPWSEWHALAAKRPGASLLLPERSGKIRLSADNKATFTATPEGDARQAVDLVWTRSYAEHQSRYSAQARSIEPRYLRNVTTTTLILGAVFGFVSGMFTGRTMRRRWLAQPGNSALPTPK